MGLRTKQISLLLTFLASLTFLAGCDIERDKEMARTLAARVHAEMVSGDFAAIYNDSGSRFKSVGSESEFVGWMKEIQENFGPLRNAREIGYKTSLDSRLGRTHELIFDLQYDHGTARESLIMVRSENDKIELWKLAIQPLD